MPREARRPWLIPVAGGLAVALLTAACSSPAPQAAPTTTGTAPTTATTTSAPPPPPPQTTTSTTAGTTTVPAQSHRVLVLGDFGTGTKTELAVAAQMEQTAAEARVHALVTTGDNFYSDDVAAIWAEPFGWLEGTDIVVWAAWGNHDLESSRRVMLVEDILAPPGRWYARPLGEAWLVVLDANQPGSEEQQAWLAETLASHSDDMVIAAFHQPPFSCSLHGSSPRLIRQWVPLFESNRIDLVLNGHDHNYQRFLINGTTYVVTGGGGSSLYRIGDCPPGTDAPIVVDDERHHFLLLEISAAKVIGQAVAADGELLDEFVVVNQP